MLQIDCSLTLGIKEFEYGLNLSTENHCIGISGDSGCGKTTLLRIIAGLESRAKGQVLFNNKILQNSQTKIFIPPFRRNIGYVFQDTRLFPHLTVKNNLLYALKRAKIKKFSSEKVIKVFELKNLIDRKPQMLSGGEKQRVAIARALLSSPELLLMDEPLSGLDNAHKTGLLGYLKRVKLEFHLPILYVSHIEEELKALSDSIIKL